MCSADSESTVQVAGAGVSRGRADAEMIWGEETPELANELARALPAAEYMNLEETAVLGVGSSAPTVEPTAEAAGQTDVDASLGKAAWRRRLSPRHREAVRSFFKSTDR